MRGSRLALPARLFSPLCLLALLSLLALTLAACGASSSAKSSAPSARATTGATPTRPPNGAAPYTLPAQWTNANGLPELATAFPASYAFAPSDSAVGYACSPQPGLLYTTHDSGSSWRGAPTNAFAACSGVFVDAGDASDVFVESVTPPANGTGVERTDLWRSHDGGATWSQLGAIPPTDLSVSWAQVAVVGSRLIGQAQVDQEGRLDNSLYVSDDGGMTWSHFAGAVANQGYALSSFTAIGSAIVVTAEQEGGTAGMSAPLRPATGGAHRATSTAATHTLDAPLSGQPLSGPTFWRSLDAGATWSKLATPDGTQGLAAPAEAGEGYALAVTPHNVNVSGQSTPLFDVTLSWSADGGTTWRPLPDLTGFGGGYVIGSGANVAIAPDGAVFLAAQHAAQSRGDDAGVFVIQPRAATPAWRPLVAGGTQVWQAITTPTGARLFSIGSNESDTHLKYVDVAGV